MKAKKMRIYISINSFRIPIPSLRFKTIHRLISFGFKHYNEKTVDKEVLDSYIRELFVMLADSEPFEIVCIEAKHEGKRVKVIISTI